MLLYAAAWMYLANIGGHHKLTKSFLSIPEDDGLSIQNTSEQKLH